MQEVERMNTFALIAALILIVAVIFFLYKYFKPEVTQPKQENIESAIDQALENELEQTLENISESELEQALLES